MGKKKTRRQGFIPPPDIDLTITLGIPKELSEELDDERPSWSFVVGSRDFYRIPESGDDLAEIITHLRSFEGMTIREMLNNRCTSNSMLLACYNIDECRAIMLPKAIEYLDKFHEDTEEVYRFRLGNKKRLFALRQGSVFALLWWDPKHEIYPISHG